VTVTDIRSEGGTYAEGLAKASLLEAEAEAARIKNEAERAKLALAQRKAEAKATAEVEAAFADAEQAREERQLKAREEAELREKREKSAQDWKRAAKAIAIACAAVSLPLQVMAFMAASVILLPAPFVLEGVAWALLRGAAAAIDDDRPSWHYRLAALVQACVAAAINYLHGAATYGLGVGLGGALCSLIGPAIWDLHEHGRIAKRQGRISRRARRAQARAERAEARRLRAVNAARAHKDAEVWERATYLAAALGEVVPMRRRWRRTVVGEVVPSEKTYRRAWDEVHGAEVGSTAASISARRTARHRVRTAQNGRLSDLLEDENPQVDSQMTPVADRPSKGPREPGVDGRKNNGGIPPIRRKSDVKFTPGATRQMSIAALRAKRSAGEVDDS
jgi:hypothetical protein